jgi:hypothetical protein
VRERENEIIANFILFSVEFHWDFGNGRIKNQHSDVQ